MRILWPFVIIFIWCLFVTSRLDAKKPSKINFSHKYSPYAPFWVTQTSTQFSNDSLLCVLKITLNSRYNGFNTLMNKDVWRVDYFFSTSYDSRKKLFDNTIFLPKWVQDSKDIWVRFSLPKPSGKTLFLFITIYDDDDTPYMYDFCLQFFGETYFDTFTVNDETCIVPCTENYRKVGEEFCFGKQLPVQIGYLKYVFLPALPPMAGSSLQEDRIQLVFDTAFAWYDTSYMLDRKGIFCLWSNDENRKRCIAVFEGKYPIFTKARELADPLVYIASDEERRQIRNATIPKLKLDDFWLNLGLEKEQTKKNIRAYYSGVLRANQFFSTYKEGWKTDRGIVYCIFGFPDEVFKSDSKEIWYYKKTNERPAAKFEFKRKKGPLGFELFELERSSDYANVYQYMVELWRKGQFID